jgi:hypothetical protein
VVFVPPADTRVGDKAAPLPRDVTAGDVRGAG